MSLPESHPSCECGHTHTHGEHCGCGHKHHHGESCGCGHDHEHIPIARVEEWSITQQNMLLGLYERHYLPVARFVLEKVGQENARTAVLSPVYLGTPQDTMEQAKALGMELQALEDAGMLTLDYDLPLGGYAYDEYRQSDLFAYFQRTVQESAVQKDFFFDTAAIDLGSMALTPEGEEAVRNMLPTE